MRNIPPIREDQIGSSSLGNNAQRVSPPAWYRTPECRWRFEDWEIIYTFANWVPIKALEALSFEGIHYRTPIIRTDVKKIGLLNALGDSDGGRIKSFTIREAI
ncbi:hypothetical protein PIB30_085373, partial [Stylosanthes scabra]|nr:hypothetical protein [Stylosanthes scabra]